MTDNYELKFYLTVQKIFKMNHIKYFFFTGRTALQDVTNTSEFSHNSLPKSSQILEENSAEPVRRGRAAVCYKEPPLNR